MDGNMDVGKAVREFVDNLAAEAGPSTLREAIALRNSLLIEAEAVFTQMFDRFSPQDGPCRIAADYVVIELVDGLTGRLYRRPVELRYEENENGIVLTGEDMTGQPSSIVYLSDAYLQKLADISGKGEEAHKCE